MPTRRHDDAEHQLLASAVKRVEARLRRVQAERDRLRAQAAELEAELRRLKAARQQPDEG